MKNSFGTTRLMWLCFAGGFLFPWLFLLFVPFAAVTIYREISMEYEDVWPYWQERIKKTKTKERTPFCADSPHRILKPATEMV